MEIQTVRTMQQFLALEPDWQRLWLLQKHRTVFQHFAWARAFVESFCPSSQWLILVVRRQETVVGLLPVWEHPKTGEWRLIGSPNADYQYLLGNAGDAQVVTEMIPLLAGMQVKMLRLEAMPDGLALRKALEAGGRSVLQDGPPVPCPFLALSEATAMAPRLKKGVRDNERRLSKNGPLRLRVIDHGEEQMQALETLFDQHRRRWNSTSRPSQFNDRAICDFYRRLCRAPEFASMLHFSVLEAGEHCLASHLGFVSGESFIYYKPTYDPAFKGAGKVLMCRLIEEALRLGLKEFDFTRGDDPYKVELATGVRHNHEARLFFSTSARVIYQSQQWLKRRVPRDADGLALPTKMARKIKALLRGR